jgi:uncharacterized protein (TIGR02996 family)
MSEESFLRSILDDPAGAAATWLVLADWLEERADPRFELVRLLHDANFRPGLPPARRDQRVRALLESGTKPCVPVWTNSIGMVLTLIPAGTFLMGSSDLEAGHESREGPQHEVEITQPFHLGVHAVTRQQYRRVMDADPSTHSPPRQHIVPHLLAAVGGLPPRRHHKREQPPDMSRYPVDNVRYEDAVAFCERLSELPEEKVAGRLYRLPTEAEWEYACRGGAQVPVPFHFGTPLSSTQANFNGGSPWGGAPQGPFLEATTPVGSYTPNAFGLYDMHGNVWEWCHGWAGDYPKRRVRDPQGPKRRSRRVRRGGSSHCIGRVCRTAFRGCDGTFFPEGLRVACSVVPS